MVETSLTWQRLYIVFIERRVKSVSQRQADSRDDFSGVTACETMQEQPVVSFTNAQAWISVFVGGTESGVLPATPVGDFL